MCSDHVDNVVKESSIIDVLYFLTYDLMLFKSLVEQPVVQLLNRNLLTKKYIERE